MTKKVLITGSREFDNEQIISDAISAEFGAEQHLLIINGQARGADAIADRLAVRSAYCTPIRVPADWENLPKWEAGPRRNGYMLELLDPSVDTVLAFYKHGAKNSGTKNCVAQARERGIEVKEFWG